MAEQSYAYRVHIGNTDYYEHESCYLAMREKNPNNLTKEQLVEIDKAYQRIPVSSIEGEVYCSVPHCWQEIHGSGVAESELVG